MKNQARQINARVFFGKFNQVVAGKKKTVLYFRADRVMQIALSEDTTQGIVRAVFLVTIFDGRVDFQDSAYTDDDPTCVVRHRSAFCIEKYKGLFGLDCTEKRIQHRQLVPALLNLGCVEF